MSADVADPHWLDALRSPQGATLLGELANENLASVDELTLITRLRARYSAELVSVALTQATLRERARAKFTNARSMWFTAPGLEQASTERVSAHHAARYAEFGKVVDVCSGVGGDAIGFARAGLNVTTVDVDPMMSRLVELNAEANGVADRVNTVVADARAFDFAPTDAVFVDPARRDEGGRRRHGDGEPPLDWCFALAERVATVGIKAAPALPLELVPDGWEVELVSENRELKETTLWSRATANRRATVLPSGVTLVAREGAAARVDKPGRYLIDPDPAVTRAGLVVEMAEAIGDAWKIDERVGFLSCNTRIDTPFGRTLEIAASMPWNLKRLREALVGLGVGPIDIRKRGSAVDVEDVRRKLRLRGDRAATVVLTRVGDAPWAFVCTT